MSHRMFDCNQGIFPIYLRTLKTGNWGGRRCLEKGKGENKNGRGQFLGEISTNFHPAKQIAQLNKMYLL